MTVAMETVYKTFSDLWFLAAYLVEYLLYHTT